MTYYVTIYYKNKTALDEPSSFKTIHAAIAYLYDRNYCCPPDYHRSNAYASIDEKGIRHIVISPSTAGLNQVPQNIKNIFIRREDAHLVCMTFMAKDHSQQ